jgi:hypothetical protein
MDKWFEWLATKANLTAVAWEILFFLISRRNTEPAGSDLLSALGRSQDARWRNTRQLERLGLVERVGRHNLWRVTTAVRQYLGESGVPPVATPSGGPVTPSFSPAPQPAPQGVLQPQPSFSPAPEPPRPPFLRRPGWQQAQTLAKMQAAGLDTGKLPDVCVALRSGRAVKYDGMDELLGQAELLAQRSFGA